MYLLYKHVNKINGKVYVGITSRSAEERWGNEGSKYKSSPYFYSAIKKYGWNNFEHIIMEENLTKEEASRKEQYYIKEYNAMNRNFGYNETSGGETPTMSLAARKKLSESMKGNQNGKGVIFTEERKQKISKALKGKPFSEERKKKMSEAAKKRHVPCSEEKKKILSEAYPNKKQVYCLETDTVYSSIHECSRQTGVPATLICRVCKGKQKTSRGFHFSYYDNNIENA